MNLEILILIISFISTVILGRLVMPLLKKKKVVQIVREEGPQTHFKKIGTATMGGIIIIAIVGLILIIYSFKYIELILPLVLLFGFGAIGFIDDNKKRIFENTDGLKAIQKIVTLLIISIIFLILYLFVFDYGSGISIPFLNTQVEMPTILFIIFNLFILIGTSNATNITDGIDGLLSGVSIIIITFFSTIAYKEGNTAILILGMATIGSTFGFMMFNKYPAKLFMGDTGSLALGGIIAAMAIILKMPLYLALVGIVPVIETISVAMQVIYFKLSKGKRLFKMAPIHHHLELLGMKETKIDTIFWLITLAACILAYLIYYI